MCRAPLYEDTTIVAADAVEEEEAAAAFEDSYQQDQERTRMTLEEMDLNHNEESMHAYMMHIVDAHADHYCRNHPMCTYTGTTNLRTIPNREHDYGGIEVGTDSANCHYIIEMRDSSRAFRYKFGRIEDIRMRHPMFQGISWFVFRELIDRWDNDTGYMQTVWSHETQLIAVQGDVNSLRQYVPRIRMSM